MEKIDPLEALAELKEALVGKSPEVKRVKTKVGRRKLLAAKRDGCTIDPACLVAITEAIAGPQAEALQNRTAETDGLPDHKDKHPHPELLPGLHRVVQDLHFGATYALGAAEVSIQATCATILVAEFERIHGPQGDQLVLDERGKFKLQPRAGSKPASATDGPPPPQQAPTE